MLQQTQVERVIPRWLAWLERWPTAEALAAASPADAIREWQGLGYNRRALALHRAACAIAERGWPDDLTELPGVGRYTADAVRNFALGEAVLPVDVNVRRVQERTGHAFGPEHAAALMDLGATVCLARVPRCGVCPLAARVSLARAAATSRCGSSRAFEGSFRQRRAAVLRLVAEAPRRLEELDAEAVGALSRDGLVQRRGRARRAAYLSFTPSTQRDTPPRVGNRSHCRRYPIATHASVPTLRLFALRAAAASALEQRHGLRGEALAPAGEAELGRSSSPAPTPARARRRARRRAARASRRDAARAAAPGRSARPAR